MAEWWSAWERATTIANRTGKPHWFRLYGVWKKAIPNPDP
jgi:hypothetical protein